MARRSSFVACGLLSLALPSGIPAQEKGEGPASLLLSYKCSPEHRTAFRAYMEKTGVAQFETWKTARVFKGYQVLFSSYVNASTWDMLAILDFDRYEDQARWREIERTKPGGLSAEALALASPVTTYVADANWQGAARERNPAKAVYFVIPYAYQERGQYKRYVDGYVIPQLKGWLAEGVVTSYTIYLNQNESGDPWDALFVLEYRDLQGLALRRVTINKVRGKLQQDLEWKKLSDAKHDFRKEGEIVIADPILPR